MHALRYLLACYPGLLVIAGNLIGGWSTWLNVANSTVVMIAVEYWTGREDREENHLDETMPNAVLVAQAVLHTCAIVSLIVGVALGIVSGWFVVGAALSTGFFAGQNGIVNAHELIHRKQAGFRWLGIWNLLLVNYGHFYVEHIRGHHKYVGTPRDPATARYGETVYAFWVRTVPQQFRSAWQLEAERLHKLNMPAFHYDNIVLRCVVAQVVLSTLVLAVSGWMGLVAYWLCSALAVSMLEYVNYIEHYGLVRHAGERVAAQHSWQSDLTFSRFTLIELSRHADHHFLASKPYHTLVSHADSPVLPGGYFSLFYRVMIPPLWFRAVHPILDRMNQPRA